MSKAKEKPVRDDVCPECGGCAMIHDEDTGETVCGSCGLVVAESGINEGPEWRAFTLGERESRTRVARVRPLAMPGTSLDLCVSFAATSSA